MPETMTHNFVHCPKCDSTTSKLLDEDCHFLKCADCGELISKDSVEPSEVVDRVILQSIQDFETTYCSICIASCRHVGCYNLRYKDEGPFVFKIPMDRDNKHLTEEEFTKKCVSYPGLFVMFALSIRDTDYFKNEVTRLIDLSGDMFKKFAETFNYDFEVFKNYYMQAWWEKVGPKNSVQYSEVRKRNHKPLLYVEA